MINVKVLIKDGSEEHQSQLQKVQEIHPEFCHKYMSIMDFVDNVNQYTIPVFPPN